MAGAFNFTRRKWIWISAILVFLSVFFIFLPVKKSLTFQDFHSQEVLAYLPVGEDQIFQLEYTHSIHRSTVIDTYIILSGNRIQQTSLQFEDMAIGMPSNALLKGERFVEKDGKYFIMDMNRVFPSINLSTSQVVISHKINTHGKQYELHKFIEPGTLIKIEVKHLTLLRLLKGVNMNG
ncbi:DUF1850 domain-containing protein [Jeotgalibacillus proteolyticus]|uniref:DUF1850 domain-containing protein n=1 Tax=Jeotgalibacillus proteolyticus TaxID=2082395 RepID=A0A2S5GH38_9BACL|nr:DUF1850 domain-containing protein [Jeotgalibacillus proteolyticus]PPA72299.1 DUF1850 domain-containing protein [Jeotgalibacillus proteolyticus]